MSGGEHRWHSWAHAEVQPTFPIRFVCRECPETTTSCQDCWRPLETSLTICDRCLESARKIVSDVEEALAKIPDPFAMIMGVRAVTYDRPRLSNVIDRLPFSMDSALEFTSPGLKGVRSPETLIEVLMDVATDWAEHRAGVRGPDGLGKGALGDPSSSTPPVPASEVFGWLRDHMLWAAQSHPFWRDQLWILRGVRHRAQLLAGMTDEHEPVPCVHCGGRVIQPMTKRGLADERRCTRCRRTWPNESRLLFANRTALLELPTTHPGALVTADDALRILPELRRNTLTQVLKRDQDRPEERRRVPERGRSERGEPLYRLGDVAALLAPAEAASADD